LPVANKSKFIATASWPTFDNLGLQPEAGKGFQKILNSIRSLRALRAELDLKPMQFIETIYYEFPSEISLGIGATICSQAWTKNLRKGKPSGTDVVSVTSEGFDYHLPIDSLVDLEKITVSLARDLEKSTIEHDKLAQRLNNPQFVEKAKPEIIERDREQLQQLADKIETTNTIWLISGFSERVLVADTHNRQS